MSGVLVDLTFHSCPSKLKQVRDKVREACARLECEEELARKLVLVIDEAVANVIRHGYGGKRDREIRLQISADGDRLTFRLRDYAEPVDASCIRPRDLSECRPGGLGINFIDSVMDSWEFRRPAKGAGNVLEMTKTIERKSHERV